MGERHFTGNKGGLLTLKKGIIKAFLKELIQVNMYLSVSKHILTK